jgi:hypothetical protein
MLESSSIWKMLASKYRQDIDRIKTVDILDYVDRATNPAGK